MKSLEQIKFDEEKAKQIYSQYKALSPLSKLVFDCRAMDITNQIASFGDAFLPSHAAKELAALRAIADEARRLLYYRNHTNIIDFQLEKADDYFYNISTELEKLDMLK